MIEVFYKHYLGELLQNRNPIVKAFARWPSVLRIDWVTEESVPQIVHDLFADEQFLRFVLDAWPSALLAVPESSQLMIPGLMTKIISAQKDTEMVQSSYWINSEFGDDDEFVRMFVRAGGTPFAFSEKWSSQRDLVLWVLENATRTCQSTISLYGVKDKITRDKEFIKHAIGVCPGLFTEASRCITDDDELLVLFFSKATSREISQIDERPGCWASPCVYDWQGRMQKLNDRLGPLEVFESTVEHTIMTDSGSLGDCALGVLRKGCEVHCKLFREFLELPRDKEASRMLRQACKNLSDWTAGLAS